MASQSTSIADLPRTENGGASNDDIQESMMVNSILQDIENDEDLNDVNADSMNYVIDTSQIPPKLGTELPSRETIQETTNNMFNDNIFNDNFPISNDFPNSEPEIKNDIDDFLNNKLENMVEEPKEEEKKLMKTLEKKLPILLVVIVSFFILSLPKLNSLIVQYIPKLSSEGGISLLCIIIKSIIAGVIYLISSFFM